MFDSDLPLGIIRIAMLIADLPTHTVITSRCTHVVILLRMRVRWLLLMTMIASITSRRPMSLATFAAVTTTFLGFLRFLRNFHC